MKKLKFILMFIAVISLAIVSCQKEGPVGPQGETGPQGPQGPTNIISINKTVAPSQWYSFGIYGQPGYGFQVDIPLSEITQDVINNGIVIVYFFDSNTMYCLPHTFYYNTFARCYLYEATTGIVRVFYYDSDLETILTTLNWTFKIVIIKTLDLLPPNLDTKNYDEVMQYLNNQ